MIRQKEQADKRLLKMEIVMGIVCLIPLLGAICLVTAIQLKESVETIIVLLSLLPLLIATPFAIRIEQKAGYYMCELCGHRYKPQYKNVFLSSNNFRKAIENQRVSMYNQLVFIYFSTERIH